MNKNYKELNIYDKDKIVEYYYINKDISVEDIGLNLCISKRGVSRVLKERNINTRLKNRYTHNSSYYKSIEGTIKYVYPTYCFMILGTQGFLEEILKVTNFNYAKIYATKTDAIKCIKISAKREFENIFNYLYDSSTIKLERKYNKWNEIKSAFIVGAIKKME